MSTVFYGYKVRKDQLLDFVAAFRIWAANDRLQINSTAYDIYPEGISVQVFQFDNFSFEYVIRVCGFEGQFLNQIEKWGEFIEPIWFDGRVEGEADFSCPDKRIISVLEKIDDLIHERRYFSCSILDRREARYKLYELRRAEEKEPPVYKDEEYQPLIDALEKISGMVFAWTKLPDEKKAKIAWWNAGDVSDLAIKTFFGYGKPK